MEKGQKMKAKSGFTLVEILIVVVILGILAAIVIPQFTEASTEAKTSSLCTDLQTVRSQIELYKIQHNDNLPGVTATGHATDCNGMDDALTSMTNQAGVKQSAAGTGVYGPYLQKFPSNPFVTANEDQVEEGTGSPGGGNNGWYFNTSTGDFYADDDSHTNL
jgi:general secretion pathway protein G